MVNHSEFDQYIKERTNFNNKTNCLEFTNRVTCHGYAVTGKSSIKQNYAKLLHRAVWIRYNGIIPLNLCIMHLCDNRKCLNINHLKLGTWADNNKDRAQKGRNGYQKGEFSSYHKLNNTVVKEIKMYKGKLIGTEVAKLYNIHYSTVYYIWQGKLWSHV